jgi:hypothetical protein
LLIVVLPGLVVAGCAGAPDPKVEHGAGTGAATIAPPPTGSESPPSRPPGTTRDPGTSEPAPPSTEPPVPPATDAPSPPPTEPPVPPSTDPSPPPTTEPLAPGDEGLLVAFLQERLAGLRYWLGPVDGVYGRLTEQAVMAFQKASGLEATGVATPEVVVAIQRSAPVVPASTSGAVVEVDRTRQLLIVARDGEAVLVLNTSTGTELPYRHPSGRTLLADTPPGHHTFFSQYDGTQPGELGPLYRPKYFHVDGIAIHGYGSVPARPASHGCVRVSFAAMDHLWAAGLAPMGGAVWVYGSSPPPAPAR